MSMDAKPTVPTPATPPTIKHREKGIRIFMWPKVIYIFPSAIVALICAIGMWSLKEKSYDPSKPGPVVTSTSPDAPGTATQAPAKMSQRDRFTTPQNLLGVLFLAVLGFNLMVMALDFPRFELVGVILLTLFALFFVLWLGAFFNLDLMRPINRMFESIYAFANAGFYFVYFLMVLVLLTLVYVTRWLDYWEVMPNEILHHHGPLSDLERFPTMNLKFDKEIPDVLEYALLGAGRLVLHVPNVQKSLVLDNVLFINSKEDGAQEADEPAGGPHHDRPGGRRARRVRDSGGDPDRRRKAGRTRAFGPRAARSARGWGRVLAGGVSGGARRSVGDRHRGLAFPAGQSATRPGWGL